MGLDSQHEKHHSFSFLYTHGPADGQGHSRLSNNKCKVYSMGDDQISSFFFLFLRLNTNSLWLFRNAKWKPLGVRCFYEKKTHQTNLFSYLNDLVNQGNTRDTVCLDFSQELTKGQDTKLLEATERFVSSWLNNSTREGDGKTESKWCRTPSGRVHFKNKVNESEGFMFLNCEDGTDYSLGDLFCCCLFIFNWRTTALQCCVSFCWAMKWISCKYTCVFSLLDLPPTPPPSHPFRSH